jgi:putative hemolysin
MTILAASTPVGTTRYSVQVATEGSQVRAAQRLRHRVFAGELGATLHSTVPGSDVDEFDDHCDHLIITEDRTGEVVGTYRMLPPDHRTGAVINLMWAGIARYMHLHNRRWLAGCASVPVADATPVWHQVRAKHLAPPALRVTPRRPWPIGPEPERRVAMPPLLKGYLRLGAWVCGAPAHDPDFRVADLFVLLSLDRVDPRYLRHFLGA